MLGPSRDSRGGLETAAEEPVGRPTSSGGENPEHPNQVGTVPVAIATLVNEAASLGKQELLLDFTRVNE